MSTAAERARRREAYRLARAQGLSRRQASHYRSPETVRVLARARGRAERYGAQFEQPIDLPPHQYEETTIQRLITTPYHYVVKMTGRRGRERHTRHVTVVSDHPLTRSQVMSQAGGYADDYDFDEVTYDIDMDSSFFYYE